jgi:hypothetical protein
MAREVGERRCVRAYEGERRGEPYLQAAHLICGRPASGISLGLLEAAA